MSDGDAATVQKKTRKQYTLEQKRWVVLRRLELQVKFDDKLHKNDQQWDDIALEYKTVFPEDGCREKASLRDAVWDKDSGSTELLKNGARQGPPSAPE